MVRPAPVYGPGDTRLVKLYQLAGRDRVILLGDGRPRYHMVYIDDLVAAFRLAGETPGVSGEAFIIAGDERADARGGHPPDRPADRPRGPDAREAAGRPVLLWPATCASGSAARSASARRSIAGGSSSSSTTAPTTPPRPAPGWASRRGVSLDDGLARTLAWYREQGLVRRAEGRPRWTWRTGPSPLLRADADGVVRLTLNRPDAYNSLSYELLGRLEDELGRHRRRPAGAGRGHRRRRQGLLRRSRPQGDGRRPARRAGPRPVRALLARDDRPHPPAAAGDRPRPRHRHRRRLPAGRRLRPRRRRRRQPLRHLRRQVRPVLLHAHGGPVAQRRRASPPWRCCSPATSSTPPRPCASAWSTAWRPPDGLDAAVDGLVRPAARQAARRPGAGQARLLPPARARPGATPTPSPPT